MKLFSQYKGLRREMYVLFFGRMMTCMGALASSMLTFIMSNKLGYSPSEVATIIIVMSAIQLPCILLGGKLADKFNKKNIIIVCDLISVATYFAMFFMEVNSSLLILFFVAGVFQKMEWPVYDALIADFSRMDQREKAYSLNYLGANLGIIISPVLGGLLFENYLNVAFLVTSIAILSSTTLIFFLVKNLAPEKDLAYEMAEGEKVSLRKVLSSRKIILIFIVCMMLSRFVYDQFNYLLPINLEILYGAEGAKYFGFLTSMNGVIVIIATPLITKYLHRIKELGKVVIGEGLIVFSLAMYIFIQGMIPMYFVSMAIFTIGEVFTTLGTNPYLTKRIPSSHRGRVNSLNLVASLLFGGIMMNSLGKMADARPMPEVWTLIAVVGVIAIISYMLLRKVDKKKYPLLYQAKADEPINSESLENIGSALSADTRPSANNTENK